MWRVSITFIIHSMTFPLSSHRTVFCCVKFEKKSTTQPNNTKRNRIIDIFNRPSADLSFLSIHRSISTVDIVDDSTLRYSANCRKKQLSFLLKLRGWAVDTEKISSPTRQQQQQNKSNYIFPVYEIFWCSSTDCCCRFELFSFHNSHFHSFHQ